MGTKMGLALAAAVAFIVAGAGMLAVQAQNAPTPNAGKDAFNAECGACHMPFQPEFLPARSWQALMGNLSKHFGENAKLDAATTTAITDYLVSRAADTVNNRQALQGLSPQDVPLRITETPSWIREHRRVTAEVVARPEIKSKANCVACHRRAKLGIYED